MIKSAHNQRGMTLIELLVAMAIGSFLMIGTVQVYNQSREAFVVNESIARVQETAQFAIDTIEFDLRMASNYGRNSRGLAVEGRSLPGDADPNNLDAPANCGARWALDLGRPVEGENNTYTLACGATGGAQPNSDNVTVRRATVQPTVLDKDRLQIQSTRIQGEIFQDDNVPTAFNAATSATHDLIVNTYYVAADSELIPGVPTLRRKSLGVQGGNPAIIDEEVAPGVENLQIQLGVDVDGDNSVDRYVNPDDVIITPGNPAFIPAARIITARLWLVVRSIDPEVTLTDTQDYEPGDVDLGVPADQFRRMQVSKTILLRNTRT
ncbi:MAG: prepilin-type N-terminal cleavage/methylation domain-containing protein [Woeseia sp.]|nr:PilW family protein [Woeseia sp.]MBT8097108.1 PilW family protein [Woeseia sp.]NNE59822.1 prepilin-type N-terminal cleavage/methylation domain-containing protein [Woeseia sp.]